MKAIQFDRNGGPEVLNYTDVPKPEPAVNQVLIKTESISVNYADVMMRKGTYPAMPPLPVIPGLEVAGIVEKTGQGVGAPRPGQRVVALATKTYAEYVAADAPVVFVLPENVDPDQAAAIPVNYLTAYHMLHTQAHVHAGQTVVVYAAAGGVGTAVIQLGKILGLTVIGLTSSEEKARHAKQQGIDHVINYAEEETGRRVMDLTNHRGADVVLNSVAGGTLHQDFRMLAPLGQVIWFGMAGGPPRNDLLLEFANGFGRGVGLRTFHLTYSVVIPYLDLLRKSMDLMIDYLLQKKINPIIYDRIPLAQAGKAQELLESRKVMGKLILKP